MEYAMTFSSKHLIYKGFLQVLIISVFDYAVMFLVFEERLFENEQSGERNQTCHMMASKSSVGTLMEIYPL